MITPGARLGRYEIRSRLGAGGMGEVYLAQDTSELERAVALKILPAELASDHQRLLRFVQEAKTASALNHPNILTVYEIGQSEGLRFLVTEYIEGVTLRERMEAHRLNLGEVLDVAAQVAGALVEAHQHGIAHRDIKPENVMLRRDRVVKVLDFGLAKLTGSSAGSVDTEAATRALVVTDAGAVMGTVSYMSPEQSRGEEVDARTDVWSLGVLLYEMLTGHLPFRGKSASHTLIAIQDEEPPPLSAYVPDMPELLQEIVSDALSKDREARLTAKQMLAKLQRLKRRLDAGSSLDHSVVPNFSSAKGEVSGRTTASQPGSTLSGAHAPATATTSCVTVETATGEHAGARRRERTAFAVTLSAVVLAGVGFGLYKLVVRRQPSTGPPVAPLQDMKFTRLPAGGGETWGGYISPDGKFLVRVVLEAGRQSLRLRQVTGTGEKEIVSHTDGNFWNARFSRDGDSIYYVFKKTDENVSHLYRVSVLGGDARKLAADVASTAQQSPDGRRLAFIRTKPGASSIIVMNADGGGEETLLTRTPPLQFSEVRWSPDGRVITYVIAGTDEEGYFTNIEAVDVADRTTSSVSSARWREIPETAWLSDGSGLIICARDRASLPYTPTQLWFVAYPGGEAYKITNDLHAYNGVSLTADSRTALVNQGNLVTQVWVAPGGDAARSSQITSGGVLNGSTGISWTPDGRVVYSSDAGGNLDIWAANADGSGSKQLTFDPNTDRMPSVSPDGRSIIFITNRSVGWASGLFMRLWRMNADGGGARELVPNVEAFAAPQFSPDSRWVFYRSRDSAGKMAVWKVPAEGGEPVKLWEKEVLSADLSPDGKQIASLYRAPEPDSPLKILIFPAEGGEPVRTLAPPPDMFGTNWAPGGRALDIILEREGVGNIWRVPLDGGKPRQLTNWKTDYLIGFAWSRDGKQLAVSRGTYSTDLVLIQNFR